jgi:hypothetical protein
MHGELMQRAGGLSQQQLEGSCLKNHLQYRSCELFVSASIRLLHFTAVLVVGPNAQAVPACFLNVEDDTFRTIST